MSRRIETLINDDTIEVLDDKDKCKWLCDEVCCNGYCERWVADYPDPEEDCANCDYFEPEEK